MKKLQFVSLFIAGIIATATVKAQTADEIINKHIEAMGGAAKLKSINSFVMEGTLNIMGNDVPLKVFAQNGYAMKQEIEFMGMKNYFLFRKDSAWTFIPAQGQQNPEPLPKEAVEKTVNMFDIQGDLLDYKTKGHSVEYLGKEDVDGTECHKIKIKYKNAEEATYYIDPNTYYIVQKYEKTQVNGQEAEVTSKFSNYTKTADGYMFAMTREGGSAPGAVTFTKVEVNKTIDPSVFQATK